MVAAVAMAKKDGASKRLARTIESVKEARLRSDSLVFDHLINFDDPDSHARIARAALQIDHEESWMRPVLAAFKEFGFDPRNPFHWRNLLVYFADAHFGKPRPGGRSRGWTDEKLHQLLEDFAQLKRASPEKNESAICDSLRRDQDDRFERRYKNLSKATIRRKLQDARNPKLNGALRLELDALVADWLPVLQAEAKPGQWTDGHGRIIRDALLTIRIRPERLLDAAVGGPIRKRDRARMQEAALVAALMVEVERKGGA